MNNFKSAYIFKAPNKYFLNGFTYKIYLYIQTNYKYLLKSLTYSKKMISFDSRKRTLFNPADGTPFRYIF